jgi:hypothetical protein
MSDEPAGDRPELADDRARLRLASGPLAGPVLCRVISMVLTRADWPVDRLHDAMLVCDALSAHAPGHAYDGHVTFALAARGDDVELRVEDLSEEGAASLVRDAMLPGVGNVLERIPQSLSVERVDGRSRLVLTLRRG